MNKTGDIDLRMLFIVLVRKIWLIVLCAILMGFAAWVYTDYFVTPMYRASVSIYVNNNAMSSAATISATDLNAAQKLVNTYVSILQSETVMERVAEEVGHGLTSEQIRGMMSAGSINETEVFRVNISNADPVMAAEIANAVASIAPVEISEIVTGSSTKIIDYARVPRKPYSPNVARNTILGIGAGVAVAIMIVVLQVLLDVRVRDESDLAKISAAPILGLIPDFALEEKKETGYETGYETGSSREHKERTVGKNA